MPHGFDNTCETIKTETVVSKAVAIEMAAGVQKLYGT